MSPVEQKSYTALVVGENPQKPTVPTGPTWARLMLQRHADYNPDLWERLRLLHEGGFKIQQNASKFIEKAPDEPESAYKWRLKTTAYVNHMARVVGYIVGGLFGVPVKCAPEAKGTQATPSTPDDAFYKEFALDCDTRGTDFSQFMRERLVDALVLKRSLVGVDMPVGVPDAVNRAQEEAAGAGRAWLYAVPLEGMLDWKEDDQGRYKWCKLVKKVFDQDDPLGDHTRYYYEFKIWRVVPNAASKTGQTAAYEVYRTPLVRKDEEIKDDEEVPLIQPLTATSFTHIPIVDLCLPEAVWAGNQVGPLCIEHYSGRSDLRGSMARSLVEIPVISRGSEIGGVHQALPSNTQQDPNRGARPVQQAKAKGFVALGSGDRLEFVGPTGRAFAIAAEELARVRDEIYGQMNTMALALANTGATAKRSGESKREDRSATLVILEFLGDQIREKCEMVYDVVSDGRAEGEPGWKASGIDSYDEDDLEAIIAEATELEMVTIPSKTWKIEHAKKVAFATLPKVSAAVKETIADEIEAGMTDEMVVPPKPVLPTVGGGAKPKPAGGAPGGKAA